MKRFYHILLFAYVLIFTSNTSCMLLQLIKSGVIRPTATQKRFCSTSMLERRISILEKNQNADKKEIAKLKAFIANLQDDKNNRYPIHGYENIPTTHHLDTYIDIHSMHYGNNE